MLFKSSYQNIGLILVFAIGTVVCGYHYQKEKKKDDVINNIDSYRPPLPEYIVKMLYAARLCTLATATADGFPHLSLMNFTYHQLEEIIILSTKRATRKFDQIIKNPEVAILINDFPMLHEEEKKQLSGRTGSITLNGWAVPLDDDTVESEKYRKMHSENNSDYTQFICGDDIAIIIIRINTARICDINDKVKHWKR